MVESALVLSGIGLLFAVVLTGAAKIFYHQEDPKIKSALEVLPGSNCGACGFAGCRGYAEAVVTDDAISANLCTAGGADVAKEISHITGKEAEDRERRFALLCCRPKRESVFFYDGPATCASSNLLFSGHTSCPYSCIGLSDCVKACPFSAISLKDGLVKVDRDRCKGCGICVDVCPKGVLRLIPEGQSVVVMCSSCDKPAVTKRVCDNGCISCKLCEKECKEGAITVSNFLAKIDYEKCTGCKDCISVCKPKAIVVL
jgi:Na+-translocating ferredoxin:NAD+ oxidoreductase RNF subunit RnfB